METLPKTQLYGKQRQYGTMNNTLTPRQVATILLERLNLPERTRSFTLRVTPEDAVVTLEYDPDPATMDVITTEFDLVKRA